MSFKHVFVIFIVILVKLPLAFAEDILGNLAAVKLDDKKFVSMVFASNNLRSSSSIFGHTFLLFHNQYPPELDSVAVEFLANSEDKNFSMTKALFYQVKANFRMRFYQYKKSEYNNENRDLFLYTLNLSDIEKSNLLNVIYDNIHKDFKYNFISSNCSYFIYKLLSDAKITPEINPLLYTLPINTIRAFELKNKIVMHSADYSSQTNFKKAYLILTEKEKSIVDDILTLKNSNVDHLNSNEKKAIYLGVDYLVLHESDIYKRDELLNLKRNLGEVKHLADSNLDENPINKRGETSISFAQDLINNNQKLEVKPGLRDFRSNYDDGISTSYFEIMKFNLVKNSKNIYLNKFTFLKVNNFIPESIYNKSFDSYLDLGWEKKLNSNFYLNFGFGKSIKLFILDLGFKPLLSLKKSKKVEFNLGSILNLQLAYSKNNFFTSEIKYIGKELEIENNLTYSISSYYRLFLSHYISSSKAKLETGINYLF